MVRVSARLRLHIAHINLVDEGPMHSRALFKVIRNRSKCIHYIHFASPFRGTPIIAAFWVEYAQALHLRPLHPFHVTTR